MLSKKFSFLYSKFSNDNHEHKDMDIDSSVHKDQDDRHNDFKSKGFGKMDDASTIK